MAITCWVKAEGKEEAEGAAVDFACVAGRPSFAPMFPRGVGAGRVRLFKVTIKAEPVVANKRKRAAKKACDICAKPHSTSTHIPKRAAKKAKG
jgi:hypothetical protein